MPAPLSPADIECLHTLVQGYAAAWLDGSAEAVLRHFTNDAVLLPHHGVQPAVGEAAVRAFWWPPDGPPTTVTRFELTPREAGGSGDVGFVWGYFILEYETEVDGAPRTVANAGTFMILARRDSDAAWRISHHMWDDPPATLVTQSLSA
jgi:ketosteroid isomerase-like protein